MKAWVAEPRVAERDGRLVVRYAAGVVVLWLALAAVGLVVGFAATSTGDHVELGYLALGLAVIAGFVASFAARPAVVADRTGIALHPIFSGRVAFAWSEVVEVAVRDVRAARGRGPALVVTAADEREARIDSLWVGATRPSLIQMEAALRTFARSIGAGVPDPERASREGAE